MVYMDKMKSWGVSITRKDMEYCVLETSGRENFRRTWLVILWRDLSAHSTVTLQRENGRGRGLFA